MFLNLWKLTPNYFKNVNFAHKNYVWLTKDQLYIIFSSYCTSQKKFSSKSFLICEN